VSRVRRALAPAALAVVLLTGCGGADERPSAGNSYVDRVNSAQERFAATVEGLSGKITPDSTAASDRQVLRGYEDAVDRVVGDLRRIDPPDEVRGEHRQLVGIMDGYGDDVRDAARRIAARDPEQVQRAQQVLTTSAASVASRINATIETINRKLA
jgi:hypothetical protein